MPKDTFIFMTLLLIDYKERKICKKKPTHQAIGVWLELARTVKYSAMIDAVRIAICCLKGLKLT